jgi:hypothetical protein
MPGKVCADDAASPGATGGFLVVRVGGGQGEEELLQAAGVGCPELGKQHPFVERDSRDRLEGDPAFDHVHGQRLVRAGGVADSGGVQGACECVGVWCTHQ